MVLANPASSLDISPLRTSRELRLNFSGSLVSMFGSMITYVAVPYQVAQITHSPLAAGLLGVCELVPILLMSFVGGALADYIDRRRLVLLAELGLTLVTLALLVNATLDHPALCGCSTPVLIAAVSLSWVYAVDAATFGVSLVVLLLMRAVPRPPDADRPSLRSVVDELIVVLAAGS